VKRCFDLLAAGVALLVLIPLLLLISVAVAVSSGWPVFFRQARVGFRGRVFCLLKFRTMEPKREGQRTDESSFEVGCTRRVTPIGRFLRRTKLDELPQLWNVVRGDMSLVGPRPEVRQWVQAYPERWAIVHSVRPGITDHAAMEFHHEEELLAQSLDPEKSYREEILPRKLDLYAEYVRNRSFRGDLAILFKTVWVVIRSNAQRAKCEGRQVKGSREPQAEKQRREVGK